MAAKTFKNATGATLVVPGAIRDVTVLPNQYVQGDFYYAFNRVGGVATTIHVYEVCSLTLIPDDEVGDIELTDIIYNFDTAQAAVINVNTPNLPIYADNAAALAAGLVVGDPYRTATGVYMVTYAV